MGTGRRLKMKTVFMAFSTRLRSSLDSFTSGESSDIFDFESGVGAFAAVSCASLFLAAFS
jgi:hypothetical protein